MPNSCCANSRSIFPLGQIQILLFSRRVYQTCLLCEAASKFHSIENIPRLLSGLILVCVCVCRPLDPSPTPQFLFLQWLTSEYFAPWTNAPLIPVGCSCERSKEEPSRIRPKVHLAQSIAYVTNSMPLGNRAGSRPPSMPSIAPHT